MSYPEFRVRKAPLRVSSNQMQDTLLDSLHFKISASRTNLLVLAEPGEAVATIQKLYPGGISGSCGALPASAGAIRT